MNGCQENQGDQLRKIGRNSLLTFDKSEGAEALHLKFLRHLRQSIQTRDYPMGARLPSEVALAEEYGISRGTVRMALDTLEREGLVERMHRRGTFVSSTPPEIHAEESGGQKRIALVYASSMLPMSSTTTSKSPVWRIDLDLLIGIEQAAKSHNYQLSFVYSEHTPQQLAFDIQRLRADNVSGMVIYPPGNATYDESIWQLKSSDIPFVLIDRYYPDLDADYVGIDNRGGGYRATEHLLILGHRRIGFVYFGSEDLRTTSTYGRWEGYCQALRDYGVPYDEGLVYPRADGTVAKDLDDYGAFLAQADRPDAIFASNDEMALKLMQLAQRQGLHIPHDLALVGFDNQPFTTHVNPALTTVAQSFIDIGLRAGNLLISRINGQSGPVKHIELPTSLVVRDSCGARLRVQQRMNML